MLTKNKLIAAAVIIVLVVIVGGYMYYSLPTTQQRISHMKSEAIGLDRTITLYANDGKPIREWKGRVQVELDGNTARFVVNHKAVIISGTYLIEEN
jgi:hypothetical protein